MDYSNLDSKQLIDLLIKKEEIIENLMEEIRELSYDASIDCVTEVLNRGAGVKKLQKEINISNMDRTKLTVCFIDVDKFKRINDSFGHRIGDKVLTTLCNVIKNNLRKNDFIFRTGGDEFIVVFTETGFKQAESAWNRILQKIDQNNKKGNFPCRLNISYGLCEYDGGNPISSEELINKADSEMYKRKLMG